MFRLAQLLIESDQTFGWVYTEQYRQHYPESFYQHIFELLHQAILRRNIRCVQCLLHYYPLNSVEDFKLLFHHILDASVVGGEVSLKCCEFIVQHICEAMLSMDAYTPIEKKEILLNATMHLDEIKGAAPIGRLDFMLQIYWGEFHHQAFHSSETRRVPAETIQRAFDLIGEYSFNSANEVSDEVEAAVARRQLRV